MTSKLVRDKIPELITASGIVPIIHTALDDEYHKALNAKLLEECNEYLESEKPEELADILEVLDAILISRGISEEVDHIKIHKAKKSGTFIKKIILEIS